MSDFKKATILIVVSIVLMFTAIFIFLVVGHLLGW